MNILDGKQETLRVLVAAVARHVPEPELVVLDWRNGDPRALALALRSHPERRAYVSHAPDFNGLYLLSCETTARLDSATNHNIDADPFSDVAKLAMAIVEHLVNEQGHR